MTLPTEQLLYFLLYILPGIPLCLKIHDPHFLLRKMTGEAEPVLLSPRRFQSCGQSPYIPVFSASSAPLMATCSAASSPAFSCSIWMYCFIVSGSTQLDVRFRFMISSISFRWKRMDFSFWIYWKFSASLGEKSYWFPFHPSLLL